MTLLKFLIASSILVLTADALPAAEIPSSKSEKTAELSLPWQATFADAEKMSRDTKKPLFIYFSGTDWCSWCMKMDSEIFAKPEFIKAVGDKFVFYKADFPIYKTLDSEITKKNEELKAKYKIAGFPTIVLLDSNLREFAKLNYREGGAKSYSEYLLKILSEQNNFEKGIAALQSQNIKSLEKLYLHASRLCFKDEQKNILQEGLQRGGSSFFMKERYRQLLQAGEISSTAALALRKEILALDPANKERLHYDIALLDFENISQHIQDNVTAYSAIEPLKEYLKLFGEKDAKMRWQIEMIISQTLEGSNQYSDALRWAKMSHAHAPAKHKVIIAKQIIDLEQKNMPTACATEE